MKVEFKESFNKDLKKVKRRDLLARIKSVILEVETIANLHEVKNIRKLKGADNYYRIKIGDYRIGIKCEKGVVTFVRVLHRKEIYRYFP